MFGEYIPILMMMGLAAVVCTAMVSLSFILGPKRITSYKSSAYECGVEPLGQALERIPIKFYLVAIIFVLFDIEVVFLWSWFTVFKHGSPAFQIFTGIDILVFLVIWIIGYLYIRKVGALDWDEAVSLAPEKLQDSNLSISEPIGDAVFNKEATS